MSRQQGVITRAPALATGLTPRQIEHRLCSGLWRGLLGLPVTRVPTSLIDLAGTEPRHQVETALDDVLVRGLISIERLRAMLERDLRGVSGAAAGELVRKARRG